MQLNSVRFTCTSLAGTNKVGDLKQDKNGYYLMIVGALDVFNSAGQYYVYDQAKQLFDESSQFMRRVNRGALRGECGHPKKEPGMTNEQFANRCMAIHEDKVSCHHKEIFLDFDSVKDKNGKGVIAIMSRVCPSGPMGPALEKSLKNPDENVCFSIRAFTDDYRDGMVYKRVLKTIVTFDQVNEPGIAFAEKYKSPALESLEDYTFSRGELERGVRNESMGGFASESSMLTASELFTSMGWNTNGANARGSNVLHSLKW